MGGQCQARLHQIDPPYPFRSPVPLLSLAQRRTKVQRCRRMICDVGVRFGLGCRRDFGQFAMIYGGAMERFFSSARARGCWLALVQAEMSVVRCAPPICR